MDADSLAQIQQIVTAATGELRQDIASLRQETGELRQEISAVEGRLRQEMNALGTDLRGEIADAKRHMGVLAEGLRHELQLVAEAVQLQRERMTEIRREVEL